MLDDDYPRDIGVGFEKIPDHVDAAFALPAHSHHGKEKVYFFKGRVTAHEQELVIMNTDASRSAAGLSRRPVLHLRVFAPTFP